MPDAETDITYMATIKDIAEKANVSLSTVSLIINGKASERKISQETEQRVLKIMREINYIPNISAKTMRSGATPEYILALFCSFDAVRAFKSPRAMLSEKHQKLSGSEPVFSASARSCIANLAPSRATSLSKKADRLPPSKQKGYFTKRNFVCVILQIEKGILREAYCRPGAAMTLRAG